MVLFYSPWWSMLVNTNVWYINDWVGLNPGDCHWFWLTKKTFEWISVYPRKEKKSTWKCFFAHDSSVYWQTMPIWKQSDWKEITKTNIFIIQFLFVKFTLQAYINKVRQIHPISWYIVKKEIFDYRYVTRNIVLLKFHLHIWL